MWECEGEGSGGYVECVCGDKGGKGEFIQVKVHTRSGVPKNKVLVIPYRKATTLDYLVIINIMS